MLTKVELDVKFLKKKADESDEWLGQGEKSCLKIARQFIDRIEMLTDLCIYKPNRQIDLDEQKPKKEDEDHDDEDKAAEDEFEFLNLSELQEEWDNEDMKVCTDEEVNEEKNQTLLKNLSAYEPALNIINAKILKTADDKNSALKVLEKLYIFLIKFVKNNKQN